MTTNRVSSIVTIAIIAFFAFMLSACSGEAGKDAVNLYANANNNNSAPASHSTVQYSDRNTCGISDAQRLLNAIDADLEKAGANKLSISTNQWLDAQMSSFSCIAQ